MSRSQHDYVYHTSMLDDYHEDCGEATAFHYSVPNLRVNFGRAQRNIGAPTAMRGPGAVPGLYATESAMNELADQLKIDPVQLRLLNEPKIDESLGIPFSSRHFGVPRAWRGEIRLVEAQPRSRLDEARRPDAGLGDGRMRLDRGAFPAEASVRTARRRHRPRRLRHAGHRHRHLHDSRAACRGEDRRAARQSRSGARRHLASGGSDLGRIDGHRLGDSGRVCGR